MIGRTDPSGYAQTCILGVNGMIGTTRKRGVFFVVVMGMMGTMSERRVLVVLLCNGQGYACLCVCVRARVHLVNDIQYKSVF